MNQITEVEQDTHWCFNGPSKRSGFSDSDQPMFISTDQELMLVALGPVDYHLNNKGARDLALRWKSICILTQGGASVLVAAVPRCWYPH